MQENTTAMPLTWRRTTLNLSVSRFWVSLWNLYFCASYYHAVSHSVPPVIDNTRDERWVEIGQNVNLTCNVLSNALFEIQWLYEGRPIASSELARISQNGRKLMLYDVQVSTIIFQKDFVVANLYHFLESKRGKIHLPGQELCWFWSEEYSTACVYSSSYPRSSAGVCQCH